MINAAQPKMECMSLSALDFPPRENNSFWIGTESGEVYQANLYDRAGLNSFDLYTGHHGFITGLAFNPNHEFGNIFLTSSIDCKSL